MIEAIMFMCFVIPYMMLAHAFKYLRKITKGYKILNTIVKILGYPFSMYDEFI